MTPVLTSPQSIRHITTITVQMLSRAEPLDQGRGEMTDQMWSDGIHDGYETRPCCSYSLRSR